MLEGHPERPEAAVQAKIPDAQPGAGLNPTLQLSSGYSMSLAQVERVETLDLRAPGGSICVRIQLHADGPRVEVFSHSLRISAQNDISIQCNELSVTTQGDLALRAGGSLITEGFDVGIQARTGDCVVSANDDVVIDGERIRLNSPNVQRPVRG